MSIKPLVERSDIEDLTFDKRSDRRFGTLDFSQNLKSRANEDDTEDEDDDGECDDESDDESDSSSDDQTTDASSKSKNATEDSTGPTYTAPTPKKVSAWTAPESKKTTPSPPTPKKESKLSVSAGVSVSTGGGSSSSDSYTKASTYSGKATFFSQGGVAGACGTVHQDSDYVVAIDASMYEGGKFCGKTIAVTRVSTGKTIHCIGADECPGCPTVQSLDLSIAAFNALGNPDEGVFDIHWEVVS